MSSQKINVFDFGSYSIKSLCVEILDSNKINILSAEENQTDFIKHGIITEPSEVAAEIISTNKKLLNAAKLTEAVNFYTSVSGISMKLIEKNSINMVTTSTVNEDLISKLLLECKKTVEQEGLYTIFDIFPSSYYLDGLRDDEPVGKKAKQISANYNLIVAKPNLQNNLSKTIERAGHVSFCPLGVNAISAAIFSAEELKKGCAFIDFGAETTTLAVFHDEILVDLLVVPFGSRHITNDLLYFNISEKHAEKIKCSTKISALSSFLDTNSTIKFPDVSKEGSYNQYTTLYLSEVIESRAREILNPIRKRLDMFDFNFEIKLTGAASKLHNLIELVRDVCCVEHVSIGDHSEYLQENQISLYADPSYTKLVGLSLLVKDYLNEKNITIDKPVNGPKFIDKWKQSIINFFGEDEKMD